MKIAFDALSLSDIIVSDSDRSEDDEEIFDSDGVVET